MYASLFIAKIHATKRNRNVNIFHKGVMIKVSRIIITNFKIISKKTESTNETIMVLLRLVLY